MTSSNLPPILSGDPLRDCALINKSDFTFYRQFRFPKETRTPGREKTGKSEKIEKSYDFSAGLRSNAREGIRKARLSAVSSGNGVRWSITVRSEKTERLPADRQEGWKSPPIRKATRPLPQTSFVASATGKRETDLVEVSQIVESLLTKIFNDLINPTLAGALFVTGETGSLKSNVARALIDFRMCKLVAARPERKPHLLTFEDPIEVPFLEDKDFLPPKFLEHTVLSAQSIVPVDYTPRERGRDYKKLELGLVDALRQKPSIVYVSEARSRNDIRDVMEFAGTGHLVITTAHAGSLTESLGKILTAVGATSSAQRAWTADRLVGVIHMKRVNIDESGRGTVLPAAWRRKGSGKQAFISDGLSAVLPGNPATEKDPDSTSSFGRQWFAQQFAAHLSEEDALLLRHQAQKLDLGGH